MLDKLHMACYTRICSERFGGLAQLGERLTGSQEVSGSIPLISTIGTKPETITVSGFFFCSNSG